MINTFSGKIVGMGLRKVYASSLSSSLSGELSQDSLNSVSDTQSFVQLIINISIPLGITCAVMLLIYAGYMMITSQGNPEKLQESREVITNAIIGFVIVILSVTLLYLIQDSLGLTL